MKKELSIDLEKLEWFNEDEIKKRKCKKEFISISTKHSANRIYFNSNVVKNYFKKGVEFLKFGFYDERYLVISQVKENSGKVFKMKSQDKDFYSAKIVTSTALVDKIVEISGQKKNTVRRYDVQWNDEFNVLYVDLKE